MPASTIWLGAGSTNVGTEKNRQHSSQTTSNANATSQGRACLVMTFSSRSDFRDPPAEFVDNVGVGWLEGRRKRAWARDVDRVTADNPSGALAHHIDGVGQEGGLA